MERWKGRVAVVTGASAGIGAAIVEDLVDSGMIVVGIARREERLLDMKKRLEGKSGTLHVLKADLTIEKSVKEAFKWIKDNLKGVDILVNNAGMYINETIIEANIDSWRQMFELNVFALGACSSEAIKSMMERNVDDGHIVNINSVTSHQVPIFPGIAPYASSKHASWAITEGLIKELAAKKSHIKVTSICPGLVKTEIFEVESSKINLDFSVFPSLESKDVADAVHYVIASPPHCQIYDLVLRPTGDNNL